MFTERFTEAVELLGGIHADSETAEVNSGWIDVGLFRRVVVILDVGDIASSGTLDLDVEQATTSTGTGIKAISGKSITQLTQAGSDSNKWVAVEIRNEELDVNNDFQFINVEVTPAVAAAEFSVLILGLDKRYEPVTTTLFDEIVD